jgi:hypothetical protein
MIHKGKVDNSRIALHAGLKIVHWCRIVTFSPWNQNVDSYPGAAGWRISGSSRQRLSLQTRQDLSVEIGIELLALERHGEAADETNTKVAGTSFRLNRILSERCRNPPCREKFSLSPFWTHWIARAWKSVNSAIESRREQLFLIAYAFFPYASFCRIRHKFAKNPIDYG